MAKVFTDLRGDHYQMGYILEDGTKKLVRIVPTQGMTPTRLQEQIRQLEEMDLRAQAKKVGKKAMKVVPAPAAAPAKDPKNPNKVFEEEQVDETSIAKRAGAAAKIMASGAHKEGDGRNAFVNPPAHKSGEKRARQLGGFIKGKVQKVAEQSTFDKYPFLTGLLDEGFFKKRPEEKEQKQAKFGKVGGKSVKAHYDDDPDEEASKAAGTYRKPKKMDEEWKDHPKFVYKDGGFHHNVLGGKRWKHGENGDHVHYDSDELQRALQIHLNPSGQYATRKEAETHALHSSGITDHKQIVDALYSHEHPDERPEHKIAGVFATKIKRKLQAHDQIMAAKAKAPQ